MSTFFIQQFGCRATQADGAALERQLLDRGCTPASDPASANIVILNTCTVTAAADAQARDAIRKLHAQNPAARLIVTGCYAQRAPEELAALPGVSHVVGNSHKPHIPGLVTADAAADSSASLVVAQHAAPQQGSQLNNTSAAVFSVDSRPSPTFFPAASLIPDSSIPFHSFSDASSVPTRAPILTGDIFAQSHLLSAPVLGGEAGHTRPTLKIQDGCNLRCSYCVIPYVRGKSRSLSPDAVIREIDSLTSPHHTREGRVAQALLPVLSSSPPPQPSSPYHAREIVLSGINLGTYGRDLTPRVELLDLLRRILNETSLDRLRLSSIEPQDVTQDLIDLFASTDRLAHHFHMPLQSGSDHILAAMHRWYRTEHYARRIELIRERLPYAAIGADVIAGFPGETDADHAATCAFVERHPFTYLHVFSYSSRPGTPAASLPQQVPPHIVKARARRLRALSDAKSAAFRRSQLGRQLRVLTLRRNLGMPADATPALSSNYVKLSVPGDYEPNRWLELLAGPEHLAELPANAIQEPVHTTSI